MKLIKRISIIVITLMLLCSQPLVVLAATNDQLNRFDNVTHTTCSEALDYIYKRTLSNGELKSMGYSDDEIATLRSFSYEKALLERASLSDDELYAIGYTDEQIDILRAYDGSRLTSNSPVLAATAVCTGSFYFNSYDSATRKLSFVYTFSWNVKPIFTRTDTMAVTWRTVNPNAYIISSSAVSKSASIYYYSTMTGEFYKSQNYQTEPVSGFDGYEAEFPMLINVDLQLDGTIAAWAKNGYFRITLQPDGDNVINLAKVYGAVAHNIISVSSEVGYTPGGPNPWTFTFTPTSEFETLATANYTITNTGQCYSN